VSLPRLTFIGEVEALRLEYGSTVELAPGGHVTPLAWDTLRARRVTVVPAGATDSRLPPDLAPVVPVRRVAIGATAEGLALKAMLVEHLRRAATSVTDLGGTDAAPMTAVDVAAAVGRAVARGEADAGMAIDESGFGVAVAANKIRGVRATLCTTPHFARRAREVAGANVLALGAAWLEATDARDIVDAWLSTPARDARELRQLLAIRRLEEQF